MHDSRDLNILRRHATNNGFEKEKMLQCESFLPNDNNHYYKPPSTGISHRGVTEQAVERPICHQSVKKAPGTNMLPLATIQLVWKWDKETITGLTKAAIDLESHPAISKQASSMVIC
jgi:hypothetical protein